MAGKKKETLAEKAARLNHLKNADKATGGTLSKIKNFMNSTGLVKKKKRK